MIYRKRRGARSVQGGYFRFETSMHRCVSGFGDGDFIRLRDEYGNTWRGMAERQDDNTVRYRLKRILDVTGYSPADPRDAYVLRLALTLGRLQGSLTD